MKPVHCLTRWSAALTVLAMAGCESNHYQIEITPAGKTVERELKVWREHTWNQETKLTDFPLDELERIAAVYDEAVPNDSAKKHNFAKVFTHKMPNDVGGSGSYTHWSTSLGSVSAYVERFRGNDDLATGLEERRKATERLADLLIGWLTSELKGETGFESLEGFLENRFREDLMNLSLHAWACEVASRGQDAVEQEWLVRIGQYLVERSYFTPQQLPTLSRAMREADHDEPALLLALIQRFVATTMGVRQDQPIPSGLQFLSDPEALKNSIDDHLRQTMEYQQLVDEWERQQAANPGLRRPEPGDVLGELFARSIFPIFQFARSDQLLVKLHAPTEPFLTNGQWDGKAKHVQWSRRMLPANSDLREFPSLLYAFWSIPAKQQQMAYFGTVVLDDDALAYYCLWYRGLGEAEAAQWDSFLASLKPGDGLADRIRSFRFSQEPTPRDDQEGQDLAAIPRELILPALTKGSLEERH